MGLAGGVQGLRGQSARVGASGSRNTRFAGRLPQVVQGREGESGAGARREVENLSGRGGCSVKHEEG